MQAQELEQDQLNEVKEKFSDFLKEEGFRKTPERFNILEEIYKMDEHFDAEDLYIHMKNQQYRVSRATVYNTLEILLDCDLVKRHQFGKNLARYEKSYNYKQHDHLICNKCDKVIEFCDPRVQQIKDMMGEFFDFNITNHSLNLYGECNGGCEYKTAHS